MLTRSSTRLALMTQVDAVAATAGMSGGLEAGQLQALLRERFDEARKELATAATPHVAAHHGTPGIRQGNQRSPLQGSPADVVIFADQLKILENVQRESASAASEASLSHQRSIASLIDTTRHLSHAHEACTPRFLTRDTISRPATPPSWRNCRRFSRVWSQRVR